MIFDFTFVISKCSSEDKDRIIKNVKIIQTLLEIVKNYAKNERFLIDKGNRRRIIE